MEGNRIFSNRRIILATHNQGKIKEFQAALGLIGIEGIPVSAVSHAEDPEETGKTFEENAVLKAHYYALACGHPVLADDSGIIADALGNRPGIYSARYSGKHGDDAANNEKLIQELSSVPGDQRTGRYVCAVAVVWPDGKTITASGECPGIIRDFYQGHGGFGYDPLFFLPEYEKTMAELSIEEKNKISHRGKALRKLIKKLSVVK
jgi:XTP/dITP diphosphohydrolase